MFNRRPPIHAKMYCNFLYIKFSRLGFAAAAEKKANKQKNFETVCAVLMDRK